MLFAPRTAYAYALHDDEEATYATYYGKNPPSGASLSFYQAKLAQRRRRASAFTPRSTALVRTISGSRCVEKKPMPFVTNDRGLNRATWDLREDGPVRWNGAAREAYRGLAKRVALALPGRYTVEMTLGGRSLSRAARRRAGSRARALRAQTIRGGARVRDRHRK